MKRSLIPLTMGIICLLMTFSLTQEKTAYAAKSGNYEYSVSKNQITIERYTGKEKKVKVPDKIAGKTVGTINYDAFYKNKYIVRVTLPSSVKTIKTNAFRRCRKLKSINLENVEEIESSAFLYCKSLTGILNLKNVETIEKTAFKGCSKIKGVLLSEDLEVIENSFSSPFFGCTSIEGYEIPESNVNYKSVDGVLFSNDMTSLINYPAGKNADSYTVPETVKTICPQAFAYAPVNNILYGSNVKKIGREAFIDSSIKSMTMPDFPVVDGVVKHAEIKNSAFKDCKQLEQVTFPTNMESLGTIWFSGCKSLKKIVLPEKVTEIPHSFCYKCESLSEINLDKIDIIHSYAFIGCKSLAGKITLNTSKIYDGAFEDCTGITEVEITKAPELFGNNSDTEYDTDYDNPFSGCTGLAKITFPEGGRFKIVDDVVYSADMKKLITYPTAKTSHFIVPYGVEYIAAHAFDGANITEFTCSGSVSAIDVDAIVNAPVLKKILIGKNVEYIYCNEGYFKNCPKLEEIEVKSSNDNFYSEDGILYGTDQSRYANNTLLVYPAAKSGKSLKVPDKCDIYKHAFCRCKYLKNVTLPKGYSGIRDLYFVNCKNITINLPKTLKKIEECWEDGANHKIFGPGCKKCKVKKY